MNIYTTIIKAIDPLDGQLKTYSGPRIRAISFEDAWNYCQRNGLGYCEIDGQLIMEMNEDGSNRIDYDNIKNN